MDLESMKSNDTLVGISDDDMRAELLAAMGPLVDLLNSSDTFREAFKKEMEDAYDAEGIGPENFINSIIQDVVGLRFEEFPSKKASGLEDEIGDTLTSACESCGQYKRGPCFCTLGQGQAVFNALDLLDLLDEVKYGTTS